MKRSTILLLLFILAGLEVMLLSSWEMVLGPYWSPAAVLGAGIGTALCFLRLKMQHDTLLPLNINPGTASRVFSIAGVLLFLVLSVHIFIKLNSIFLWISIAEGDTSHSDIIPQIITLTRRFLRGEQPYTPISYPDHALYPTYLPLQWMPYCVAEIFHKDYRWVPATVLWTSCLYHFILAKPWRDAKPLKLLAALWPLIVWAWLLQQDDYLFAVTVESLIAGYYLFLTNAATQRRLGLLAAGLCVTLLSRYSIVFWVPGAAVMVWLARGWRPVAQVGVCVLAAFILIYWFPFLRHDGDIFFKSYAYHSGAAYGEWVHTDNIGRPVNLYNGLGFATWAYRFLPYTDVHVRLAIFQKVHIALCLLTAAGLTIWYARVRGRVRLSVALLFSLKVYLVIFYAFIQIPYKYLFFTPVIVTAVLMRDVLVGKARRIIL